MTTVMRERKLRGRVIVSQELAGDAKGVKQRGWIEDSPIPGFNTSVDRWLALEFADKEVIVTIEEVS